MKHSALQQRKRKSQNEKQEAATCGTQVHKCNSFCSATLNNVRNCCIATYRSQCVLRRHSTTRFSVFAVHLHISLYVPTTAHTHTHIPYTSVCVCNLVSTQLRVKIFSCQYRWTQHCNFLFYFYFYPFVAALLVLLLLSSTI